MSTNYQTPAPKGFNTSEQCWTCDECGTFLKEGYIHAPNCSRNREREIQ